MKKVAVQICPFVVVVTALCLGCKAAPSPRSVAADVESAMKRSDAVAMAGFVSEAELKAHGVTKQQVAKFFENELFRNWSIKGDPITGEDSYYTVYVDFTLQSKVGGLERGVALFAIPGDTGIDTPSYIKSVIWLNASVASTAGKRADLIENRLRNVAAYIEENELRFETTYGLRGLYYENEQKVVPWAEVQDRYIKKSMQIQEQRKAASPR
jgi:hypothetical protein